MDNVECVNISETTKKNITHNLLAASQALYMVSSRIIDSRCLKLNEDLKKRIDDLNLEILLIFNDINSGKIKILKSKTIDENR